MFMRSDLGLFVYGIKICALRVLYELIYTIIIVPCLGASEYLFIVDISPLQYALSWVVTISLVPCVFASVIKESIMSTAISVFYYVSFIPGAVMLGFRKSDFYCWFYLYYIILFLGALIVPKKNIVRYRFIKNIDKVLIVIMFGISFFFWARYANFRILYDIGNVYGVRLEARSYSIPSIMSYVFKWLYIFTPFFISWFLDKKEWFFVIVSMVIGVLLFFYDGQKSILFNMGICFLIAIIMVYGNKTVNASSAILNGVIITEVLSLLEYFLCGSYYIVNFVIRRLCFVPASLNYCYYEFFSYHELNYFSDILRRFGLSPRYASGLPRTIGKVFFGNPDTNANNGLFSDAYANLGNLGIIMPLFVLLLLWMFDCITQNIHRAVRVSLGFLISFIIMSTNLTTGLLTHGIMIMMIVLLFMPASSQ